MRKQIKLFLLLAFVSLVSLGLNPINTIKAAPLSGASYNATINITVSSNPITVGSSVIVTIDAVGQSNLTPSGTVSIYDGSNNLTIIPLGNKANSTGEAVYNISSLGIGSHNLVAQYSGDSNYNSNQSNPTILIVNPILADTTTTLTASSNSLSAGATLTLTAKVSSASISADGTISFMDGTTVLGSSNLDSTGQAVFTTTSLPIGAHTITAAYNGNNSFKSSTSSPITINVNQALVSCVASMNSNITSARPNDSVILTVNVSGNSSTPTGNITFTDGKNSIGTVALDQSGQAIFTTTSLDNGTHPLTANYAGDKFYSPCVSNLITLNIDSTLISTSTIVLSDNLNISIGDSVNLTATVSLGANNSSKSTLSNSSSSLSSSTASNPPTLSGSISFLDGTAVLGTSNLDANNQGKLKVNNLGKGLHNITAIYAGDKNYTSSQSDPIVITAGQSGGLGILNIIIPVVIGLIAAGLVALFIILRNRQLRKKKLVEISNIIPPLMNKEFEKEEVITNELKETNVPKTFEEETKIEEETKLENEKDL